jgi:hypothetical protein
MLLSLELLLMAVVTRGLLAFFLDTALGRDILRLSARVVTGGGTSSDGARPLSAVKTSLVEGCTTDRS